MLTNLHLTPFYLDEFYYFGFSYFLDPAPHVSQESFNEITNRVQEEYGVIITLALDKAFDYL